MIVNNRNVWKKLNDPDHKNEHLKQPHIAIEILMNVNVFDKNMHLK